MTTKKELRKQYKEKRATISSSNKMKWDDLMLIHLQQFDFGKAQSLLTYWQMEHEPNMQLYTSYLRHSIYNLQIAYPVSNFTTETMKAMAINEETVYKENSYGITEPTNGEVVLPETIDIVFLPMLICDRQGYRVGYGKGFYDKYLALCRKDVIKIGFNYFDPIEKIADTNKFDIPLDYCITPQKIYEF
ncbi:MAG: 5-formyltetrahydrofolate cyclo-ligase [Chitinophagaceae bacterium]|nr:5-formyltetrahydrofolate cyclo-ligase [Chitinophagaceae bacterium]MCW5905879.1 5-formyltetrahydrofolate cyclo-ligase [Chitinophagaceae bacterium]